MARDVGNSLLLQEWQELLKHFGSQGTSTVEGSVQPHAASAPGHESEGEAIPVTSDAGSNGDGFQRLLAQAGLDNLRLPSNGALSPQWQSFLLGLEQRRTRQRESTRLALLDD